METSNSTTANSLGYFRQHVSDLNFFFDESRTEIFRKISHLLDYSNITLFIEGDAGSGKTALLKHRFIKSKKPNWQVSIIDGAVCKTEEQLMQALAKDYGVETQGYDLSTLSQAVAQRLGEFSANNDIAILVIDNIEKLANKPLSLIAEMIKTAPDQEALLRVIFFGRNLPDKLSQANIDQETTISSMALAPLDENSVKLYLHHGLKAMGLSFPGPFDDATCEKIAKTSAGVFRRVNTMADKCISQHYNTGGTSSQKTTTYLRVAAAALVLTGLIMTLLLDTENEPLPAGEASITRTLDIPAAEEKIDKAPSKQVIVAEQPKQTQSQTTDTASSEFTAVETNKEQPTTTTETIAAISTPALPIKIAPVEPTPEPKQKPQQIETKPVVSWLEGRNPRHYTLQILASGNKDNINRFIEKNNLTEKTHIIETKRNGKNWYSLIYGDYATQSAANNAKKLLPQNVQKLSPWARPFSGLQLSVAQAN